MPLTSPRALTKSMASLGPVVLGVDEILRIINDFDRRAAVDGELDAVLGGQEFLTISSVPSAWTSTATVPGFHVGNGNFHLGVAGVSGQPDFDGGGGAGIAGGLDLHGSLDGLAGLLRVLHSLGADLRLRLGVAVLVGLDGAGGAVGGLGPVTELPLGLVVVLTVEPSLPWWSPP